MCLSHHRLLDVVALDASGWLVARPGRREVDRDVETLLTITTCLIHLIYFHFVSWLLMNICSIHSYVEFWIYFIFLHFIAKTSLMFNFCITEFWHGPTHIGLDLTCKRGSVGHSEWLLIPRPLVRFRLKPENSISMDLNYIDHQSRVLTYSGWK